MCESISAVGSNRVNRGCFWNNNGQNCRSANRNMNVTGNRNNNNNGFRAASAPRVWMDFLSRWNRLTSRPAHGGQTRNAAGGW